MHAGAIWDKNPNALIMLRDPSFLASVERFATGDDLKEIMKIYGAEKDAAESQTQLKRLIRALPKEQFVDGYTCTVVGVRPDNKRRLNIVELKAFRDAVLDFLTERFRVLYPEPKQDERKSALRGFALQHERHREFMEMRTDIAFGHDRDLSKIMGFIQRETSKQLHLTARCTRD